MRAFRILVFAGALAFAGAADALPIPAAPSGAGGRSAEAFCGPYRCAPRPFWRYRSGAGFLPYRGFGFAPARPRFAPFGFRRFGGSGGGGYGGRFGGGRRF